MAGLLIFGLLTLITAFVDEVDFKKIGRSNMVSWNVRSVLKFIASFLVKLLRGLSKSVHSVSAGVTATCLLS